MEWAFIFILPIVTVLAVGLLGSTRRIGFWIALILAVVLTPVGGFLVAIISGPKRLPAEPKRSDRSTTARANHGKT